MVKVDDKATSYLDMINDLPNVICVLMTIFVGVAKMMACVSYISRLPLTMYRYS